ncbi:polysaccharide deacetylase family protein [Polyangium sorediatum]|uniref:Polysaccharide deacetylase family protein n=1 Tax=Polyangium sorediatum TaxID=889274 RepID=A0ABT6NXY2_9BACT|nr:polysaccharide deacetylase family protein [Polyangium sorediatum]MDI1433158.1 polysaccharide deacetylase family protein [Polyangium sorediatum]
MILLYHHILPEGDDAGFSAEDGLTFRHSPEAFRFHLEELRRRGYRFGSLDQLVRQLDDGIAEDDRSAFVTFDDGWRNQHEYALPILRALGISATFFVTTDHLRQGVSCAKRMGPAELRTLVDAGMTIGSHTRTHPDLARLDETRLEDELRGSRQDLEDLLGKPVTLFAYPGGSLSARVVRAVRRAGYEAACCSFGPARNDATSLFWMYRDVISASMRSPRDRYRLSPLARQLLTFRVERRLRASLHRRA